MPENRPCAWPDWPGLRRGRGGVLAKGDRCRDACGPDFKLVVPGIRLAWASTDDQKRHCYPRRCRGHGADYLVIGRPITGAKDPVAAAVRVGEELAAI